MKRLCALALALLISLSIAMPAFAAASYRRLADNVIAAQNFESVLSFSKGHCITGIELMAGGNTPFYVYTLPKNHKACDDVPASIGVPEIASNENFTYYGAGIIKFSNPASDLPLLYTNYLVLDTEGLHDGSYVAVIRNK